MLINKYRTDGNVAYIELTKGKEAMIDTADLDRVLTLRWHAFKPSKTSGYYAAATGPIYMHRFIVDAPKGDYVDHVNHDTLDNRRSNLSCGTQQENTTNRDGSNTTSKTGIRGVSTHRSNNAGGMFYYVFKCHCVTCKKTKYFPHTEEGLEAARVFAEAHYAAMKKD